MIWTFTLGHTDPATLRAALVRHRATTKLPTTHILLDHHWPMNYWDTRREILEMAEEFGCKLMAPFENMGGHGGYNWLIKNLPLSLEDFVITYDSDCNPITEGWDVAMQTVLQHDPKVGYVSTIHEAIYPNRRWNKEDIGGVTCAVPTEFDMFNITMWRASFLIGTGGVKSDERKWYGYIEQGMAKRAKEYGLRHVYLHDFREHFPVVANPEIYNEWKRAHAFYGFAGNFSDYLYSKLHEPSK